MPEDNLNSEVKIENKENKESTQTANPIPKARAQTLADDMAKALETGQGSVIKSMIHEQELKEMREQNQNIAVKKNITFVFISIILVVAAIVVFLWISIYGKKAATVSVEPKFVPVIFLDTTKYIDVSGMSKDKIAQTVNSRESATEVKIGGVEGIYLTQNNKILGFRNFLSLISGNLPLDKANFLSDNFLIGVTNTIESPDSEFSEKNMFILLQMRSMSDIFSAMREWENKMFLDLHGFFSMQINADTNYLLQKDFEDGIIQNKNARILRDNDGKIVLMYVYADNTSVLITTTENTAREVITRLAASEVKK